MIPFAAKNIKTSSQVFILLSSFSFMNAPLFIDIPFDLVVSYWKSEQKNKTFIFAPYIEMEDDTFRPWKWTKEW